MGFQIEKGGKFSLQQTDDKDGDVDGDSADTVGVVDGDAVDAVDGDGDTVDAVDVDFDDAGDFHLLCCSGPFSPLSSLRFPSC